MRYTSIVPIIMIGLSVIPALPAFAAEVSFADSNLESAVRLALGKPAGSSISTTDVLALTSLSAGYYGISSISGIEHCTNLVELDLRHNDISSITQLGSLTKLRTLELQYNAISDLSALSTLRSLQTLHLQGNQVTGITALQGILSLVELWLGGNQITSITPLANHTNLQSVWLNSNQITSIQPLASCTGLTEVWLGDNAISSISPLASLNNLHYVWIENNQIVDISALGSLSKLDQVWANGNRIYDIGPLADNSALADNDEVDVRDNCLYIASGSAASADIVELEGRGVWMFTTGQAPPPPRDVQGSPNPVSSRGKVRCSFAVDGSLQPLTYTWSARDGSGNVAGSFDSTTSASPEWTAPENNSGEDVDYQISVAVGWAGDTQKTTAGYTQAVGAVAHQVYITEGPMGTPNPVASGRDAVYTVAAEDNLGHEIAYEWSATGGEFDDPEAAEPTWTAPVNGTDDVEQYEITCTAYCVDEPEIKDEQSHTQDVNPVVHTLDVTGPTSSLNPCAGGGQVQLSASVSDTRGHSLTYEWSATAVGGGDGGAFSDASAESPIWTAPINSAGLAKEYTLTLTVTCSGGTETAAAMTQQVVPGAQHVFPAGRVMIGMPLLLVGTQMMEDVLEADTVITWDPTANRYVTVTEPTPYELGRGYWAQFGAQTARVVEGYQVTGERDVAVSTGWNMLCSPYTYATTLQPMLGNIGLQPFAWTDQGNGYELVANITDALNATHSSFEPFWGYWMLAHRNTQVTWSPTHAASLAARDVEPLHIGSADAEQGGWQIQIVAEAGGRVDACNYLGVASAEVCEALCIPNPPASQGSVDVYFPTAEGKMAASVVPLQAGEMKWDFVVTCDSGETVRLRVPDLSCVPNSYRLTLTDRATGKSVNLRTTAEYSFSGPGTRSMQLVASPAGASTLAITTMQAQQIGAQAVALTYTLSADADVVVEVRNIAGRAIRQIPCGLQQAGISSVGWDLRGATGTPVPSGRYLCTLTARSDDGTQTSALRAVNVVR